MDRPDPAPAVAPPADPPAAEVAPPADPPAAADPGPAPPAPEPPPPPAGTRPAPRHPHPSPYRVLANLAVVFVSLFLFVRVFAVEPFGVPTGSMAPALIGNHRQAPCPRCGHPVRVGAPNGVGVAAQYDPDHVACPNCLQHLSLLNARDLNGDRLLVDKHVFDLRRPRRWEMAVFHCPDTDPKEYRKPYVKRVVGLPGERLLIVDGDVYVLTGGGDGVRELLRKGLAEVRETRVTVFDMSYVPKPGGWNRRWLVELREDDPRFPEAAPGAEPADPAVVAAGELRLDAAMTPRTSARATYLHWNLDARKEEVIRAWCSYDGVPLGIGRRPAFGSLDAARDFSLECEVEVVATSGDASFACRLDDGADRVVATIPVAKQPGAPAVIEHEGVGPVAAAPGTRLEPGGTYRVEFSFVDRRAILAIDGKPVGTPADLPDPGTRPRVDEKHPLRPLRLEARGCRVVVRNLKLYRDTHYTQYGEHGTFGDDGRPNPAAMGPDEYFMLGDNSGNSQDGRKWPTPGVPEGEIIGKPFLVHQPLRAGRVTIGGRERHYQTVDWSRLRWLH